MKKRARGLHIDYNSKGWALLEKAMKNAEPGKGVNMTHMTDEEFIATMFKQRPGDKR